MKTYLRPVVAALFFFLTFASCSGDHGEAPQKQAVTPPSPQYQPQTPALSYLSQDAVAPQQILDAPPAADSQVDRQDVAAVLELQANRTDSECARAVTEANITLGTFFGPPYGPLTSAQVTHWSPFFEHLRVDTDFFVNRAKHLWMRPRPYVKHAEVHPCLPQEPTTSYPSGHTTISRVFADVLSEMEPAMKGAIRARADEIASDRILGGVHHPTDIAAGKVLGDAVFEALLKSESFERDLHQAEAN